MTATAPWCRECPLRRSEAFTDFSADELAFIERFKTQHRFAASRTELVLDGDTQANFATLFMGWAMKYKILLDGRRQILAILLPGDCFGLDSVALGRAQASVEALTDIAYCSFSAPDVAAIVNGNSPIAARLLRRVIADNRRLERHLAALGVGTALERLAAFFVDLHARLQLLGMAGPQSFAFPLTQLHLADYLGVNVVHLNRMLRRLREDGLLRIQEHTVLIEDPQRLRTFGAALRDDGAAPMPLL